MSSSEKIDLYRDFATGVYLSEAPNPVPLPLSLHILAYSIHCTYSHREGGRGESWNKIEV